MPDAKREEIARRIAAAVTEEMSYLFGGSIVYFRKGPSSRVTQIWKQIHEQFDGGNQRELAIKFGYSLSQVYKILASFRDGRGPAQASQK